ncbi:MAG: glycosyltransferase family 4 protein [Candidatus Omnitrophota bacterium]|nr:glycosyltransferase family 4 protein [Candidatus Omnitrophota bacterium]
MRIGILIDEYVSGAAPVLATQEARYLEEAGFEVDILVGTKFNSKNQRDNPENNSIKFLTERYPWFVRKLNFRFPFFSFFSPQHLISALFAPLVIKEKDYDLIIAHGLFSSLIACNLRRVRKISFFSFFWDPSSCILPKVYAKTPLRSFFFALIPATAFIDKGIARKTDKLILGSKFHLKWFSDRGIKDIDIVYPGCFPAQTLPDQRGDFVLAVDRWDIGSLPDIFLEILQISKYKFELKVVGHWHSEHLKNKFLHKVAESGLEDLVEVTGPLSFEELKQLFLQARCFVHPTLEAFGMSALEAASYGCPFIIPRSSGVTDLFVHGKHGFFPTDKNIDEYAMYIEKLVKDKYLAYEMGRSAWEAAKRYTWRYHAQRITDIIRDFLN